MNNVLEDSLFVSQTKKFDEIQSIVRQFSAEYVGNSVIKDNIFAVIQNYARKKEIALEMLRYPIHDDELWALTFLKQDTIFVCVNSGKIIALEKMMNHFLEKEIFIWESYIMDKIQSPQNRFTKGYFNVNILKGAIAVVLYIVVEVILGIIWSLIFDDFIVTLIYCVAFGSLSGFVLMNWLKMWIHLPEYYKSCFIDLYKNKLQIKSED